MCIRDRINGVLREMGRVAADSAQELTLRCVLTVGDKRYNESNALVYAGAQELLEAGSPMAVSYTHLARVADARHARIRTAQPRAAFQLFNPRAA